MSIWGERRGEGAGDMVMVLWFFLLLALVAGGIAIGTRTFFGAGYDVRELEAGALLEVVQTCLEERDVLWEQEGDFYLRCRVSEKVLRDFSTSKLGILICETSCQTGKEVMRIGSDFTSCDFTGKNEEYARCRQGNAVHIENFITYSPLPAKFSNGQLPKEEDINNAIVHKEKRYEIVTYSNHEARKVRA